MSKGYPLTFQQKGYISFFSERKTIGQIAEELDLSRKAVSNFIKRVSRKH